MKINLAIDVIKSTEKERINNIDKVSNPPFIKAISFNYRVST